MSEEEVKQESQEKQEVPSFSPKSALDNLPGAPNKEQLDKWKAAHGHIFVMALSENEVFIYKSIDRLTWRGLNAKIAENQRTIVEAVEKMRNSGATEEQLENFAMKQELDQEELTVEAALLWSSITLDEMKKKAGIITSLANNIMEQSRFVPPQVATLLTEEI